MSEGFPAHFRCPRCGLALPTMAAEGLCPRCLLHRPFDTDSDDDSSQFAITREELAPHFPQLEILECLGRGGMGVVYKARQKSLNRLVALKLLAPERVDVPGFAERFENEARLLATLNHPNIVTIHEFGNADGFYFLVMEYVDGSNLRALIRRGPVPVRRAVELVSAVAAALHHAHRRGVVHRDIKPENLLTDAEGRVMVVDFGIAKLARTGADHHAQALTQPLGSPRYMAPEQQRRDIITGAADVYALGVLLHELITGAHPVRATASDTRIPHALAAEINRALSAEPARRHRTALAFRIAILRPPAVVPAGGNTPPRERWAWAARLSSWAVVFALTYAAVVVGFVLLSSGGARSRSAQGVPKVAAPPAASAARTADDPKVFLAVQGDSLRSANFILRPNGVVRGSHAVNEAYWEMNDGNMTLFDEDGKLRRTLRPIGRAGREFYYDSSSGFALYRIFPGKEKTDISGVLGPLVGNVYLSNGSDRFYWKIISPHQIVEVHVNSRGSCEWIEQVYSVPDHTGFVCRTTAGLLFSVKVVSKDVLEENLLVGTRMVLKRTTAVPDEIREIFDRRNMPIAMVSERDATTSPDDPLWKSLAGKVFEWRRASDDVIFTRNFTLSPSGLVTGYRHENECFWNVRNGELVLYNRLRQGACRLTLCKNEERGILLRQINGPHVLRELPPPVSPAPATGVGNESAPAAEDVPPVPAGEEFQEPPQTFVDGF